jgi:hypothetical protein
MKRLKLFVIRLLAKHLVKVITEEDVLRQVKGSLYAGNVQLSEDEEGEIRDQARTLLKSPLWHFMRRQLEYLATMKMGKQATDTTDIIVANTMFYNIEVQEEFLNKLSK